MNETILVGYIILSSFSLIALMFQVVSCKAGLNSINIKLASISDNVKSVHGNSAHFRDILTKIHYQALSSTSSSLEVLEMAHIEKENYERCGHIQASQAKILRIMADLRSRFL